MIGNVLMTESFSSSQKRHYFLDFKRTSNNGKFIQITRSDHDGQGGYRRTSVIVFEQDFHFLVSAMSSLFHHSAHLDGEDKGIHEIRQDRLDGRTDEVGRPGIPGWDPVVKPRERLLQYGAGSLADHELLAIIIGSGTPGEDAVALSKRMLEALGGIHGLLGRDAAALRRFDGIGPAKACSLLALLELVGRLSSR
ncbi:MAG: hypothetical protein EOO88_17700 [Pedobacter sp.]|nr:MAG: hypothetical protein EOO88_17700 [Pedobacter sp.]